VAKTATASVTVGNVAPDATIDAIEQPNPHFVLTTHNLTFRGSFTDVGCMDNHSYVWDFGDGTTAEGACDEEHDPPNATGTAVVRHSYSEHGRYTVTLTVMDDDTGQATVSAAGTIRVLKAKPGTGER
jgi:PKD repeat protein